MEYTERSYRKRFASENREWFVAGYRSSDLWIAVDSASYDEDMRRVCVCELEKLWREMEGYISADPGYGRALAPYFPRPEAPDIMRRMSEAAAKAGIGPMGAVAGAVAKHIAGMLKSRYGCRETIIENGGDIYAEFSSPLDVSVFAGTSPLSERVGFRIPPEYSPLGICTSSGTVGHSLSFGKADAVMIICRDALLADSYATAYANRIQTAEDMGPVMDMINSNGDILGSCAIKNDRIGVAGNFALKFFR